MQSISRFIAGMILILTVVPCKATDWKDVQKMKLEYIRLIAQHALEQQKLSSNADLPILFPAGILDCEKLKIVEKSHAAIKIRLTGIRNEQGKPITDAVRFSLPETMNLLDRGSGIAITVRADHGTSEEIRLGMRFISDGGSKKAEILPFIPVMSRWGDEIHEIYFDWSFINYGDVNNAIDVLKKVEALEITVNALRRAPGRGPSGEPQSGMVTLSGLRLVDYLFGSFDPARHSWKDGEEPDLTLQHRCQEVTGVVAGYGGTERIRSAVASLDLCVRTQCWDGSFLDGRRGASTVTSGEYTFGFTTYGLLTGYLVLDKEKAPELDAIITVGPYTMTRKAFYQRMFYRSAMARAGITTPSKYRDDIIGGNTLITGANRVLGYAIAMRMVADILDDEVRKNEVLGKFNEEMDEIMDAQGKFSGGFPILGEGDRYKGAGIHYDNGYTRTHMDWLIIAVNRTGDPRFIEMLKRYQTVFLAVMDSDGKGLVPLLSERGTYEKKSNAELVIPDATAQVGMKYNLPVIAQWGYNCGLAEWIENGVNVRNFWSDMSNTRGYRLGAHSARLLDDFNPEPEPVDPGFLFPRQFPIWTTRLYNKQKELVKTSHVYILPDGTMVNDFKIEIGLYPESVGIPVTVISTAGTVKATAVSLDGWPQLLPGDSELQVYLNGKKAKKIKPGIPFKLKLNNPAEVRIEGPSISLPAVAGSEKVPFRAVFMLESTENIKNMNVMITLHNGTVKYRHDFNPGYMKK